MSKYNVVFLFGLLFSGYCSAAFTLSGTRFIYEEGRNNISIDVVNNGKETYGGQVWLTNTAQPSDEVYFTPAPTFFRVDGQQKQIVRLININKNLPKDRESIFWLNVQEIPPAIKGGENVLAIAMNTQVKVIYRPKTLITHRDKAENGLLVVGNKIKNPTPYYFAVTSLKVNGKKVKLTAVDEQKLSMFAPFSEIDLSVDMSGHNIELEAIDDYGARRDYILNN